MGYFVRLVAFLFFIILSSSVYSQKQDIEQLLRTADFKNLVGTQTPVNFQAQLKEPFEETKNISDLSEFVAIGVIHPEDYTLVTQFDLDEKIVKQIRNVDPWMGVDSFSQKELPSLTLQDGLKAVKQCMAQQKDPTPENITRVIVYKTLNTGEIIYDYVFKDNDLPKGWCQEFLYSPATGECQRGNLNECHITIENMIAQKKAGKWKSRI